MEKRLSRTDLIFALGFLFFLIVAIAAFFSGVKVGTQRTEALYAKPAAAQTAKTVASPNAYSQQDLVSFYHNVFQPHREWMGEWSATRTRWQSDDTADRASSLKELAKLAAAKYEESKVTTVSSLTPDLMNAQNNYLKSLKLYESSFGQLAAAANEGSAEESLARVSKNPYYTEAVRLGLLAQNQYYGAMLKWGSTVNLSLPDSYDLPGILTNAEWSKLPLLVKNSAAAQYMFLNRAEYDFLPQDLAARIDQFILSGQANRMKQKTIRSVVDMLTGTDAIRSGDYLSLKSRYYAKELVPLLPFFSSGT
ncbi:hypothetical protein [Cohnella sp. JJ-181]|uniref:hypothetical protein n=1 Tax=Cohnella rhizoplanae TaxID=2974897 RepID=UPI0022FFA735|nr:hypothetical protein [Cohnella sp. JJ-181]CAI6057669.1 hypothetical protein COHCIP112018_01745 [Cohnella sp. JJ-181]